MASRSHAIAPCAAACSTLPHTGVDRFAVEIEPEVRDWLVALPARHYASVEDHVDYLADHPTTLGEPLSRHLGGPLRELRFDLGRAATRVTYWLAPERRIVPEGKLR
ncbi:type II toxin-antitoxin system RelE/ParE family toxin [Streptomyces sp. LS1784]|uniref:type II toxin-antitoxin system RelE/ParE family toxin n=1 Tax=Streptomyces sp. LS1784 TaxID=2851533 RepID=UPI0027E11EC9|nr:type II toxin-antitoxin system RelE/ParE family toxin [Streptomyces sp. LS1784]